MPPESRTTRDASSAVLLITVPQPESAEGHFVDLGSESFPLNDGHTFAYQPHEIAVEYLEELKTLLLDF